MPRLKRIKYLALAERAYNDWLRDQPEAIAVDTETHGVVWYDRAFCVTVAWRTGSGVQSYYFELDQVDEGERARIAELLTQILTTKKLVFHNPKFDLQKLILEGLMAREDITPDRIEDSEACYHLFDEHGTKSLKHLAKEFLGEDTGETSKLRKVKRKLKITKKDGYDRVPREVLIPYAVKDAEFTLRLWELFRPKLEGEVEDLYYLEMELCLVLLDIEAEGYKVDLEYVTATAKDLAGQILRQELEIQDITRLKVWYPEKPGQKTPEGCLNPNAWQQTLPIIQGRGIPVKSTGDEVLKPYIDDPFVGALLELRRIKKLHNTYFMGILEETQDGIIHPNFRQHGTKTGRMSSGAADG